MKAQAHKSEIASASPVRASMFSKKLALAAAVAAGLASFAADFPTATGDIASATDWGGTLPSTTEPVRFAVNKGSYTASADVQFAAMTVTAANVSFNMGVGAGEPPRQIKIQRFESFKKNQNVTLNGGLWNLQDGMFLCCAKDKNRSGGNQLIDVTGGAIVTNVNQLRLGYRDSYNTLRFSNGSKGYIKEGYWDYGIGVSNSLEVLSGSEVVFSGYLRDSSHPEGLTPTFTHSRIFVSGAGSRIAATFEEPVSTWPALSIGTVHGGGTLTAADGGTVDCGGEFIIGKSNTNQLCTATALSGGQINIASNLFVGAAKLTAWHVLAVSNASSKVSVSRIVRVGDGNTSYSNSVIVADGGELALGDQWYVGYGENAYGNSIIVTSGGKITGGQSCRIGDSTTSHDNTARVTDGGEWNAGIIYLGGYNKAGTKGGHNNSMYISNATVRCTRINFGMAPTAVSNTFVVAGADTVFTTSYTGSLAIFGVGGWHSMTIADGASWTKTGVTYLSEGGLSNRLSVVRGASVTLDGSVTSGTNALSGAQTVEVSGGASLTANGYVAFTRNDNLCLVSNGTFSASGNFYIGNRSANVLEEEVYGNRLEIYGTNPAVASGATLGIYRDSTLKISLPEEGYGDGVIPITAATCTISDTVNLDVEGIAAMRQCRTRTRSRYTLIHTTSEITVADATLAAVNAAFAAAGADGCYLYVSGGKDLMLRVPLMKGLSFTVR